MPTYAILSAPTPESSDFQNRRATLRFDRCAKVKKPRFGRIDRKAQSTESVRQIFAAKPSGDNA
jgi:hypothetical protein